MRILVLGGTAFLSQEVARAGVGRGHEVSCACRGVSGAVPDGARHVPLDRADPDWGPLAARFDAVVDVARRPTWVRAALAHVTARHWVFVSTVNVYADDSVPDGTPGSLALRDPAPADAVEDDPGQYGPLKVACEQAVRQTAEHSTVVRPGLIVGPGDPSGRFSYWPDRLAEGGEVLAPGSPDDRTQVIDVRDLATWLVVLAESDRTGVLDGTGPVTTIGTLLAETGAGVGFDGPLTWVPQEALAEQEVQPWMGPRSLPLWLPLPEYAGLATHDATASVAAGLAVRPVAETARDTLAWLRTTPEAATTGLTRAEERQVLESWHAASGRR